MKKILVIQTAFIGDLIMITPVFKNLRSLYPNSQIDVIVNSKNRDVLKNNPHINKIYGFDKSSNWKKFLNFCKLLVYLRKEKYDLAVSLQISMTSSLFMVLGKIPIRIGSSRQKFLTNPVKFPRQGMHIRERVGIMLRELQNTDFDLNTELFPSKQDREKVERYIEENKFLLGISPGSVRKTKMWPKEYFADLLSKLDHNTHIYMIGGPDDVELCNEIANNYPHVTILAGKLSLLESAALVDRMDLMLTNDSAPLHISNAMDTPVFAFFGPTVKKFGCYPYRKNDKILEIDLECRPCGKHGDLFCPLDHFKCMKEITPAIIFDEITKFRGI